MSEARAEILNRIALALDGVPSAVASMPGAERPQEVPRAYRADSEVATGSAQALEILVDRLVDYRAVVHRAASETDISGVVAEVLSDAGSLVYPDGLDPAWLSRLPATVVTHEDSLTAPLGVMELDAIDAVLTACRVAVADTGTIILDGQPDQGRRAITLVPDTHVCVVHTQQVVHLLPQAITQLAQHPTRPQTWIAGPSATSDIELNRVEGVHGPRNLHVIIVGA